MYVGALFRQGERENLGSRVNHAMPPPVKDNDTLAAANNAARPAAASLPPAEAGIRQQPVALEVAVTVNGARALAAKNVNLSPRAPRPYLFSAMARSFAFLPRLLPDNCFFSPTKKPKKK